VDTVKLKGNEIKRIEILGIEGLGVEIKSDLGFIFVVWPAGGI